METIKDVSYIKIRHKDKMLWVMKNGVIKHFQNITEEEAIKLIKER